MQGEEWQLAGKITTTQNNALATHVQQGVLLVSGELDNTVTNSGTTIDSNATMVVSGLLKNGSAGTIINSDATLQIGNGGASGDVIGSVSNDGTLAFNRSDSYTYSTAITGTGNVKQIGSGETILGVAST